METREAPFNPTALTYPDEACIKHFSYRRIPALLTDLRREIRVRLNDLTP
ncbi:MAG TPA: hypothetical protein VGC91_14550 [Pyrinomonadaceae bacterium]